MADHSNNSDSNNNNNNNNNNINNNNNDNDNNNSNNNNNQLPLCNRTASSDNGIISHNLEKLHKWFNYS